MATWPIRAESVHVMRLGSPSAARRALAIGGQEARARASPRIAIAAFVAARPACFTFVSCCTRVVGTWPTVSDDRTPDPWTDALHDLTVLFWLGIVTTLAAIAVYLVVRD